MIANTSMCDSWIAVDESDSRIVQLSHDMPLCFASR